MQTATLLLLLGLAACALAAPAVEAPDAFDVDTQVKGGVEVNPVGKWKSIVAIHVNNRHWCGGSILSARWVLTAAHCQTNPTRVTSVVAGMHDQAFRRGSPRRYGVSQNIRHEYYRDNNFKQYDIGLILVNGNIAFNSHTATVRMVNDNTGTLVGSTCFVVGWGMTHRESTASVLQEAQVDVYSNSYCSSKQGGINNGHVCVGKANRATACHGDSGGPLYCRIGSQYQVAGATSWGTTNCPTSDPGVYSRLSFYRGWVRSKTGL